MSKEIEKFEKDFKATKPKLKTLTAAEGKKRKKDVVTWLDKTWEIEDKITDAVAEARKAGVTGKKAADFAKDAGFQKALKAWKDAVSKHHGNIDELNKFSDEAQALHDALSKRCDAVEKELKKSKGGLADVKITALVKEARRALPDLKKAGASGSGLPGHVVFYARKLPQSIEAIVKQAVKKVDPKELPKSLTEAGRNKAETTIKGLAKKIAEACREAEKNLSDAKKVKAVQKLVDKDLADLKKLHDKIADAAKSMKKEIEAAPDKKDILAMVKLVSDSFKDAEKAAEKLKKEAAKAA